MRLERTNALLVVIDVQERLMPVIAEREEVERNLERLVRGASILAVPALVTEQYVKGLGRTVEPLRRALEQTAGYAPIEKDCFSAHGCPAFAAQVASRGRRQILVAGVEAHVCVYQTVGDLLSAGFEVSVVADAVSSRTLRNRDLALQRMASDGAKLTSTEMTLFELCVRSGTDEFRAISQIIK